MNKKRLAFGSVCGALFLLSVLSSMFSDMLCLISTAVFWTLCVLKLGWKIAKHNPIIGNAAALIMLAVGYGVVFYLIMGLGRDLTGMFKAAGEDIAGLMSFPIREQTANTIQRMVNEILKVKSCIASAVKTGRVREAFTVTGNVEERFVAIQWSWHYLILGVTCSCIILYRLMRCGLSILFALPGWLSEWMRARKERESEAATA